MDHLRSVISTGKDDNFILVGCNNFRDPFLQGFDPRALGKGAVYSKSVGGLSVGHTLPMLDVDTQLMYLTVRGSSTLLVQDVSQLFTSGNVTRVSGQAFGGRMNGFAAVPKYALDMHKNEIARLMTVRETALEAFGVFVPRRIEAIDDELFPESMFNKPELSGAEWRGGEDKLPKLVNPNPKLGLFGVKSASIPMSDNAISQHKYSQSFRAHHRCVLLFLLL